MPQLFAVMGIGATAGAAATAGTVATGITAASIGKFLLGTAISMGLNALAVALMPKPDMNAGGVTVAMKKGSNVPRSFILGTWATNGHEIFPGYVFDIDKNDNKYLSLGINLSDLPIHEVAEVWVDGKHIPLAPQKNAGDPGWHYDDKHGRRLDAPNQRGWIRIFDGTQTAVDPILLELHHADAQRPIDASFKMTGVAYAVATFKHLNKDPKYSGIPELRFVVQGKRLYDPRKDTTVGGSGSHRWGNEATYEHTNNPIVMVYNIIRGIKLSDGEGTYGFGADAFALPTAYWFRAMNVCDQAGTEPNSTTLYGDRKRYSAGIEVSVNQEPSSVVEALLTSCGGIISEVGGQYLVKVGGPSLPVAHIDDDTILRDNSEEFTITEGLNSIYNGVTANFPSPAMGWESDTAVPLLNPVWEAQDGNRRLLANIDFSTTFVPRQVRRLMRELAADNRRERRHSIVLPPTYIGLNPTETITWSSAVNGYDAKLFEITSTAIDPLTLMVLVQLREVDPTDYDYNVASDSQVATVPSVVTVNPITQGVDGFAVRAIALADKNGKSRKPAIELTWSDELAHSGFIFELKVAATSIVAQSGTVADSSSGMTILSDGILPDTDYLIRAKAIKKYGDTAAWSDWLPVKTLDIRVSKEDLEAEILADLASIETGFTEVRNEIEQVQQEADNAVQQVRDDIQQDILNVNQSVANAIVQAQTYADDQIANNTLIINNDIANVRQEIIASSENAKIYTDTSISNYSTIVSGEFSAMSGRIDELTAALTSENLIRNGEFNTSDQWVGTTVTWVNTASATDAFDLLCSEPHQVRIGNNIKQSDIVLPDEISADDRLQVRFLAGRMDVATTAVFTFNWFDVDGLAILPNTVQNITVNQGWKNYSFQIDLPDNAATFNLTVARSGGGSTRLNMAALKAETVNIAIEARLNELQAAQANTTAALATLSTNLDARFANTNARITGEETVRASADSALSVRIDTVTAQANTNKAGIISNTQAIANTNSAMATMDTRLRSQFGAINILPDGYFRDYFGTEWTGDLNGTWFNHSTTATGAESYGQPADPSGGIARAIRVGNSGTADDYRASSPWACAATDSYSIGYFCFRNSNNSPRIEAFLEYFDSTGASIGYSETVDDANVNGWRQVAKSDIRPPAAARTCRLVFKRKALTSGGIVTVAAFTVSRMSDSAFRASADIRDLRTSIANSDFSFAQFKTAVDAQFANTNATIVNEQTVRANADSALGVRIDAVSISAANAHVQIGQLQTAVANSEAAFLNWVQSANTRMNGLSADLTTETTLRSNADSALSDRIVLAQAKADDNAIILGEHQTLIANNSTAIGQLDNKLAATFGTMQVVRDPDFSNDLTYWTGSLGNASDLIQKNGTSSSALYRDMPGKKALMIKNASGTGNRISPRFDAASSETYDLSFFFYKEANSPTVRVFIEWLSSAGTVLGRSANALTTSVINKYEIVSLGGLIPTAGATQGRVAIAKQTNGSVEANGTAVTGITLARRGGSQLQTLGEITSLSQVVANNNSAFTNYVSQNNTRVANAEGQIVSNSNAINLRATKSELNSALASLESSTNASLNAISAAGKFRSYTMANTSIGVARIGLTVDAVAGANTSSAGIFLEADSSGTNHVSVVAGTFAVVNSGGATANRTVPFYIKDSAVYMRTALIEDATIGALKVGKNALYVPYHWSRADIQILSARNRANPVLLFDRTITVFEGGGFVAQFLGVLDTGGEVDAYGGFYMVIDGVEKARTHIGARTSGADTRGSWTVDLSGNANGKASTNIKVYAYSAAWNNFNNSGKNIYVRNARLTVSGSRR